MECIVEHKTNVIINGLSEHISVMSGCYSQDVIMLLCTDVKLSQSLSVDQQAEKMSLNMM